ncbi:MAG: hypothetical protein ABJX32_06395 [Tateyamaria sp.]|uniref:hypothetical protein n=1 Tax=Tateyamaria sp. TaxID=1929288 RepID=UPI00329EB437
MVVLARRFLDFFDAVCANRAVIATKFMFGINALPLLLLEDDGIRTFSKSMLVCMRVHVFNQVMARFDGERMVETHSNLDSITFFEQLGLLPDNAMAVMLGGTRLR